MDMCARCVHAWVHCMLAWVRTLHVCICTSPRAWGDSLPAPPPQRPSPFGDFGSATGVSRRLALPWQREGGGGAEAAHGAQGFTLRVCGQDPPQPAPPTLVPAATNPLSRVTLFSLEGKQRVPISIPAPQLPGHSQPPGTAPCVAPWDNTHHGAVWSGHRHRGTAAADAIPVPPLLPPITHGAHSPGSPWGPVARPIHGALRGASRTGRRGCAGVSTGDCPLPLKTRSPGTPYSPCSPPVAPVAPWDRACLGSPSLRSGQGSPACLVVRVRPSHPAGTWHTGW